ncbi:hypothetical protein [Streptomyces sp. ALI-76-A]|uniref:hypothetical protein n=1 Tax=Streptomyces sp. ALI-76-A TaxID=3025736 RepID=UPI00256ED409|nr:hypothetical protein [Streptomyces sp. ALI-76-A]MDL5201794.1 hypothetical protein [Streptomyces sp. ALI-76-A]
MLLFAVVAAVTAFALCGYGCGALAERGVRRSGAPVLFRGLAALCGSVAAAAYAWGLLIVAGAFMTAEDGGTDSAPVQSCRTPGWLERAEQGVEIVDYTVSFIPLGFVCETSHSGSRAGGVRDGGSYDNGDVPWYVNAAALGFALAGAGCAVSAGYASERAARAAGADGAARATGVGSGEAGAGAGQGEVQ